MTGKRVAHFEITGKLGEGGMGVVYEAIDRHLDRHIALKILPPDIRGGSLRFHRPECEFEIASRGAGNSPKIAGCAVTMRSRGIRGLKPSPGRINGAKDRRVSRGETLDQKIPFEVIDALIHGAEINGHSEQAGRYDEADQQTSREA
jgi:serine/threonine protein kinase